MSWPQDMKDISIIANSIAILNTTNYVHQGEGYPVILIHGLAASLHDWDDFIPDLVANGYAAYALDLLGHGDSPKPDSRAYNVAWLFDHFVEWVESLELPKPPVLIGHSLGGYLVLDYARRFPARTHGLVLVNPFYRLGQLPALLRHSYRRPVINSAVVERTPEWLFRFIVDITSISLGNSSGASYRLPERARAQTALDYKRTAAGVYNIPNTIEDLTPFLSQINLPALVVWGDHDATLDPSSFEELVALMPGAEGRSINAAHVVHQTNVSEFNQIVMEFLDTF